MVMDILLAEKDSTWVTFYEQWISGTLLSCLMENSLEADFLCDLSQAVSSEVGESDQASSTTTDKMNIFTISNNVGCRQPLLMAGLHTLYR